MGLTTSLAIFSGFSFFYLFYFCLSIVWFKVRTKKEFWACVVPFGMVFVMFYRWYNGLK